MSDQFVAKAYFPFGNTFYRPGDPVAAETVAEMPSERRDILVEVNVEPVAPPSIEEALSTPSEEPEPEPAPEPEPKPAPNPPSDVAVGMVLELRNPDDILAAVEGDPELAEAVAVAEAQADEPRVGLIKKLKGI